MVPELTSKRNERIEMLVNSCIRNLDSMGRSIGRKSRAVRPREEGRHVASNFRRAVSMKIAIKDRKGGNIAARLYGLKTVSKRRGTEKT